MEPDAGREGAMMQTLREKAIHELERVVQCRETARCHWRHTRIKNKQEGLDRIASLNQFNEVVLALKESLIENSCDLMIKALALAERTP